MAPGMLHTVNKSPYERNSVETCLRLAKSGSDVLFLEDGVYAVTIGTALEERIEDAAREHVLYALGPDLAARGINEDQVVSGVKIVDYDGFVDLAVKNDRVQTWL